MYVGHSECGSQKTEYNKKKKKQNIIGNTMAGGLYAGVLMVELYCQKNTCYVLARGASQLHTQALSTLPGRITFRYKRNTVQLNPSPWEDTQRSSLIGERKALRLEMQ